MYSSRDATTPGIVEAHFSPTKIPKRAEDLILFSFTPIDAFFISFFLASIPKAS